MRITFPLLGLTQHGGTRVLVQIANKLAEYGCKVTLLYPKGTEKCDYKLNSNIEKEEIGFKTNIKVLSWLSFIFFVIPKLKGTKIIANQFVTFYPTYIASLLFKSSSYLYIVQDIEFKAYNKNISYCVRPFALLTYKSKKIIAANNYLKNELDKFGCDVLYSMNLGIDSIFFNASQSVEKDFDVIYFARHEKYKRIDRFFHLLPYLNDNNIKVLCITQNLHLKDELEKLNVNVLIPKDQIDLIKLIDSSKISLLTSDHEGFSLPPLECMSRGLPSVMYECGGPSNYVIDGYNAFVAEPDDSEYVISSLKMLLESKELYSQMSKNAYETSLEFNFDKELDKLTNLIVNS
ncbi:glycosyltransferase family 4 protein [Photobacterium leiognathi]|uniref:glycosyltransferase family 4 protein n=1 Tax=Photobacterium leiognathi TaxID=553611 RepID=UPI0029822755|nr:glycosyltransferase family 4 protein [Photobacterium leiognathi]